MAKIGRNEPCPCGSGKKYKRCCMNAVGKQHAEFVDSIEQMLAMNPDLSVDELNVIAEHQSNKINNTPVKDFCGLTPGQINNWLYAPFSELEGITVNTPSDLSTSPVMRYLELMLETALANGGQIKATAKGNLPAALVKEASALLPEFAFAPFERAISISEFAGANEDKFNALHYCRVLAEIAGIFKLKSNKFHVSAWAKRQYQQAGLESFFPLMLKTAIYKYNWGYMDGWEDEIPLQQFWLFMVWRLQHHESLVRLVDETIQAFPDLLNELYEEEYMTDRDKFAVLIESRFIHRFLQFFGFVMVDPRRFVDGKPVAPRVTCLRLFHETFEFAVG
ncbi:MULTISPECIES: YecA family protein [unclassified Idiomarina]|uniref:YecA family protein n=1 Tax=unclassified Idiomarina TaxID=2614829 RepID=UPI00257FE0F2|nr:MULTISPECIES: SEC-C metal-binding domain-containing protein [unclassified Idiomarina]|tara:strand:+ start:74483 stop:75487 length:1005 start_codon:yes stop_codon:yes gene_type:complete